MENGHGNIITWIGNIGGAGAVLASLLGWLPVVGAIVAMVWYAIQIKESETFRNFWARRHAGKIAKLKGRLAELEHQFKKTDA